MGKGGGTHFVARYRRRKGVKALLYGMEAGRGCKRDMRAIAAERESEGERQYNVKRGSREETTRYGDERRPTICVCVSVCVPLEVLPGRLNS